MLLLTFGFVESSDIGWHSPVAAVCVADGIVVRGAKAVATLAPYANEYFGLTPPGRGSVPAEIVYFALPMATPGMRVVCRRPLAHEHHLRDLAGLQAPREQRPQLELPVVEPL